MVPPLRHPGGGLRGDTLARVVVDIEVLGLQHLEVEGFVLHLIAAEVLGFGRRREGQPPEKRGEDSDERGAAALGHPYLLLGPSLSGWHRRLAVSRFTRS